jgi:hypothetical protein
MRGLRAKAVTSHTQRQNSGRGGCLITGEEQVERMREKEVKVASRRVSIAGEQFFCGGRAVPYQRAEEAEREKNSILFDKVTAFPVCFKFVSNRRTGELYL